MAYRVLIAEDMALVALDLQDLAQQAGHKVVAIVDSIETARTAMHHAPDIAIVDLNLSDGFTGPMVGEELRSGWGTRIIYLTANPGLLPPEYHSRHRVIGKPLVAHEFLDALSANPIGVLA